MLAFLKHKITWMECQDKLHMNSNHADDALA